jgi:hypothetical protein
MDKVFDSFEKALLFAKEHENWFDWHGDGLKRALDLYETGFLKVMRKRDSQGRRVIVCNNRLDMEKFNADDVFRLHCLVILLLATEHDTQLCGAIYVDDLCCGISMKYLSIYPLKSTYDFTVQLKVTPMRLKNICIIGLPSFAAQFLHIIKMGLSETMNKRLQVMDNMDDLWNYVDKNVMTTEYGGDEDERETIDDFRKFIDDNLHDLNRFVQEFDIDMEKADLLSDFKRETIGSFRKLQID